MESWEWRTTKFWEDAWVPNTGKLREHNISEVSPYLGVHVCMYVDGIWVGGIMLVFLTSFLD